MEKGSLSRREFLFAAAALAAGACVPRRLYEGAAETGSYNKDGLLRLTEISQQPWIDQRVGVVCVNGVYPRETGINFFNYGADVLTKLGFQTTEIALVPQEFTAHTGMTIEPDTTLDQLATRPDVAAVLSHPRIKNILITTEVSGAGTVNGWELPAEGAFTPERLEKTYQEYYRFASELLTRYSRGNKEIVILGTNEIDWKALGGTSVDTSTDLTDHAVSNSKKYLDAYLTAIRDANGDHPDKKPLKAAVEINRVRDIWDGSRRVLNAVIPNLDVQPDIIAYSSYDTLDKGALFPQALDTIRKYAPGSEIVISEFGKPENRSDAVSMGREGVAELYRQRIQESLDAGIKYFMTWQLTDNECDVPNPNNDDCNGFWMVRPDGSLSDNYRTIRQNFAQS